MTLSHRRRYRRLRRFFLGVALHAVWYDIVLNRPGLRVLRPAATPRWRRQARRLRALALEMGGVLIKLGQFLSVRVDLLPPEVTAELAGLQDEVPEESYVTIAAAVAADLGRSPSEVFASFEERPLGAASLAQAHRARLHTGEAVVVKVLRPGIEDVVAVDLAAITLACGWLKRYKALARRVDLDWLSREFSDITRRELDLRREAANAGRFASDLGRDSGARVPRVYPEVSAGRVLTLEDVGYIKITDTGAMTAAGISPRVVADRLYQLYMRQVFETFFIHVDPHPGNLFVRPLPTPEERAAGAFAPGGIAPFAENRPFEIVFVDFGMMTETPERLREALREYVIGLGTRDAARVTRAYVQAGTLLPGADLKRIEAAHEALFQRFAGLKVGEFRDIGVEKARLFVAEYRDLIREAPFQVQVDMLFVMRAVGMLSGLAARLDPDFDLWAKTVPHARRYARESLGPETLERLKQLVSLLPKLAGTPETIHHLLTLARDGEFTIRARLEADRRHPLTRLYQSLDRLGWTLAGSALALCAAATHAGPSPDRRASVVLGVAALVLLGKGLRASDD